MVMTSNRLPVAEPADMWRSEFLLAGLTIRNNNSKLKSIRNTYSKKAPARGAVRAIWARNRTAMQSRPLAHRTSPFAVIPAKAGTPLCRKFGIFPLRNNLAHGGVAPTEALSTVIPAKAESRFATSRTYSGCAIFFRIALRMPSSNTSRIAQQSCATRNGCTSCATGQQPKCNGQQRKCVAGAPSAQPN